MKCIYTTDLLSCVYSISKAKDLFFRRCWDIDEEWETRDNNITIIDGAVAMQEAQKAHIKICGNLQEGVGYIFRFTKDTNKLYPYHMTMLRKTAANIERGSARYGSGAIRAEL